MPRALHSVHCLQQITALLIDRADATEVSIVIRYLQHAFLRDILSAENVFQERYHIIHPFRPPEGNQKNRINRDGVQRGQRPGRSGGTGRYWRGRSVGQLNSPSNRGYKLGTPKDTRISVDLVCHAIKPPKGDSGLRFLAGEVRQGFLG